MGVYRLWRDLGYAFGALLAGIAADALGLSGAIWIIGALTALSGVVVAIRMRETIQRRSKAQPNDAAPTRAAPWPRPSSS